MRGFIYIGTPYTRFAGGLDAAFHWACRARGELLKRGIAAFSPIVHAHPVAEICGIDPTDHAIWLKDDEPFMRAATGLLVVKLPGWDESYGISQEVKFFTGAHKPIAHATFDELQDSDFPRWLEQRFSRTDALA